MASTADIESLTQVFTQALQDAVRRMTESQNEGASGDHLAPTERVSGNRLHGIKPAHFAINEYKDGVSTVSDYFAKLDLAFSISQIPNNLHISYALLYMGAELNNALKFLASPIKPEELSYDELKAMLIKHFDETKNKFAESIKFRQVVQQKGESIGEFSLRLRQAAIHCDYDAFLDRMLLEQFFFGLESRELCNEIIVKKPETFTQAYEMALTLEAADKSIDGIKHTQEKANKLGYSQPKSKTNLPKASTIKHSSCNGCGGKHLRSQCKFRDAVCHKCRKVGHISKVCRSITAQLHEDEAILDTLSEGSEDCSIDVNFVNNISSPNKLMMKVSIDGSSLNMELDTGAPCSLISLKNLQLIKKRFKLQRTERRFVSYTGNTINCIGRLPVNVQIGETNHRLNLYVVKGEFDTLLGREWISHFTKEINFTDLFPSNPINEIKIIPPTLTSQEQQFLNDILNRYTDLFSMSAGKLAGPPITVHLKENATPVFCRARDIPLALRDAYTKEIETKLASGFFKRVEHSTWASTTHIVAKKNGKIRVTGNYKPTLNPNMIIDEYPIPKPEHIFHEMRGAKLFCHLDITDAYTHLGVDEKFSEVLTLNTPTHGLIRPTRAVYGAANIPAIWQRRLETVLRGVPNVKNFFDDIVVYAEDFNQLRSVLDKVLNCLHSNGLKLNRSKCTFAAREIEFLGHKINAKGIQKSSTHTDAIRKAPKPMKPEDLQLFLGKATYYNAFIPNLSSISQPLREMLRTKEFIWSPESDKAYNDIKEILMSPIVLMQYDPSLPLVLATDASKGGLGAVLSHRLSDGKERPIAYASRVLSSTEQRYPQMDKEALAIVWAVQKFFMYLYARHWTLITDHKPLSQILQPHKSLPVLCISRMANYAEFLSNFDFHVMFKPTKANSNADYCSRIPLLKQTEKIHPIAESAVSSNDGDDFDQFMIKHIEQISISAEKIGQETKKDPHLGKILSILQSGRSAASSGYKSPECNYTVLGDCLIFEHRVVIPPVCRKKILNDLHQAHLGIVKMKCLARSFVYWPGIDADIENVAKECQNCAFHANAPPKFSTHHWDYPDAPWERIHIDYAGPIYGKMLLIVTDAYSKWLEVKVTNNATSSTTIALLDDIFAAYGAPVTLVSDNGTCFTSEEFSAFLKRVGVKYHKKIAPYHPSTNGQAERYVQTVKAALKAMETTTNSLHSNLNQFLRQYRKAPHSATGQSPSQLFLNRSLRTSLDVVKPDSISKKMTDRNKANFVPTMRILQKGQYVFFSTGNKPSVKWAKGRVASRLGDLHYNIESEGKLYKRHIDQIRSHVEREENKTLPVVPPKRRLRLGAGPSAQNDNGEQATNGKRITNHSRIDLTEPNNEIATTPTSTNNHNTSLQIPWASTPKNNHNTSRQMPGAPRRTTRARIP